MKKFKVIEPSRFIQKEEACKIKGGIIVTYCDALGTPYTSASCPPHVTCGPAVVQGYSSCGSSMFNFCGVAVQYKVNGGMCEAMIRYNALCGLGFVY